LLVLFACVQSVTYCVSHTKLRERSVCCTLLTSEFTVDLQTQQALLAMQVNAMYGMLTTSEEVTVHKNKMPETQLYNFCINTGFKDQPGSRKGRVPAFALAKNHNSCPLEQDAYHSQGSGAISETSLFPLLLMFTKTGSKYHPFLAAPQMEHGLICHRSLRSAF